MKQPFIFPGGPIARLLCISGIIIALASATSWAQKSSAIYNIDAARSKIEIAVFKEGILSLAGHNHTIAAKRFAGEVQFNPVNIEDSSVRLSIQSGSLVVVDDPSESEKDRKEVQATMLSAQVLDAKEFPMILFHSTAVNGGTKPGGSLMLTGRLSLHGVDKDIVFPVSFHIENDLLRATGKANIAQTDFGIKPIKAAAGTIRVKNQIEVKVDMIAQKSNP